MSEQGKTIAMRAAEAAVAEATSMGAKHVLVALVAPDGAYQVLWVGEPLTLLGLADFARETARRYLPGGK